MSATTGYSVDEPKPTTVNKTNPQYSALNTETTRRTVRSDDALNEYVENLLKSNKIVSFLQKFRAKVERIYSPIATVVLAFLFYLSRQVPLDDKCQGNSDKWCFIGFIYFSLMIIVEIIKIIIFSDKFKKLQSVLDSPALQFLGLFANGIDIFLNLGINIGILYAFLEREQCLALMPYLTWWAAIEIIPLLSLITTIILTFVTMAAYLHSERKKLD